MTITRALRCPKCGETDLSDFQVSEPLHGEQFYSFTSAGELEPLDVNVGWTGGRRIVWCPCGHNWATQRKFEWA